MQRLNLLTHAQQGYETVEAEREQHQEEHDGPELRHRQTTHHLRVGDERQRRSCRTTYRIIAHVCGHIVFTGRTVQVLRA